MKHFLLSLLLLVAPFVFAETGSGNKYRVDLSLVPQEIKTSIEGAVKNLNLEQMSASEIDDLVKLLYLTAQYDRIKAIRISDSLIQIQISKRARINQVNFLGLTSMSRTEARRIVMAQEGDVFEPDTLIKQGQALQDMYKSMGYLNAEVDIEFPTISPGKVDLNIIIRAGLPTQIKKIEFKTENQRLEPFLKDAFKGYLNDILTQEVLQELQTDVSRFLKKKKAYQATFPTPQVILSPDQRYAFIHFEILNADLFEFRIQGSTLISSLLTLDDTLQIQDVPSSGINLLPELTNRLRQYYFQRGYARVDITLSENKIPSENKHIVTFIVKEGKTIKLDKFLIQGQFSRSPEYYVKKLLRNASDSIQQNLYIKEDLDKAMAFLIQELQNEGFLLAQISSSRVVYNPNKDGVNVLINLDEGLQTSVKSVEFENVKAFSSAKLSETVGLKTGLPLQLSQIEKSILNLKTLYKENGYLEMLVLNEKQGLVQYNEDNSEASLVFKIFEGPQVRVQSIVIDGLKITREFVVRFELDFIEGDLLTPTKIEESISRLQRTGYFSSVDIRTLEDKTEVSNRTVLIRVTEADPGLFQMGTGITNERDITVRGYIGVGYRNLFGTGRGVSFRSDASYNISDIKYLENRFTVGYLEPFLFDTRYKGRFNLTRSNTVTDFEKKIATITVQQTWSVEKDFTSHVTGVWDVYSRAMSEDFNIRGVRNSKELDIAATGVTLDVDYRDNLVRPRKGNQSRLNVEYGSPVLGSTKTIHYVRSSASFTHYKSFLSERLTWSNGVRFGYLQNVSMRDDGAVPYDKKGFYLGGPSTIRGFDPTREAFPDTGRLTEDTFDPKTGRVVKSIENNLRGQATMSLLRSTFSYPIWGIIDGTIFYDGGMVNATGVDLGFVGYRDSAGIGILVNTPVGPLNLELGFKLGKRYRGELPSVFHLSFGSF